MPRPAPRQVEPVETIARRVRAYFQRGVVAWLRGERNGLALMSAAVDQLETLSRDTAFAHLWAVAGAVLESLSDEGTEATPAVNAALSALDQQIREFGELGAARLAGEPPEELLTALRALVARSRSAGRRVLAISAQQGRSTVVGSPKPGSTHAGGAAIEVGRSIPTRPPGGTDAPRGPVQSNGSAAKTVASSARIDRVWDVAAKLHQNRSRWEQYLETLAPLLAHSQSTAKQAAAQLATWHRATHLGAAPCGALAQDQAALAVNGDGLTRFVEDALGEISSSHRRLVQLADEAHVLLADHAAVEMDLARWAEGLDSTGSQRFIESLLLRTAGEVFAVPTDSVTEIVHVCGHGSGEPPAQGKDYVRGDCCYPVASLHELLGFASNERPSRHPSAWPLILLATSAGRLALRATQLIGRRRVLVAPVGAPLDRLWWLSGAVVMGDGRVAFLLDVQALLARGR